MDHKLLHKLIKERADSTTENECVIYLDYRENEKMSGTIEGEPFLIATTIAHGLMNICETEDDFNEYIATMIDYKNFVQEGEKEHYGKDFKRFKS